jgi:hypothetical protein
MGRCWPLRLVLGGLVPALLVPALAALAESTPTPAPTSMSAKS